MGKSENDDFDWDDYFPKPERQDDREAKRWRGALFWNMGPALRWIENDPGFGRYHTSLEPPSSVTFPICAFCHHVIWEWPHFEEDVPKQAICEQCAKEEEQSGWIENQDG